MKIFTVGYEKCDITEFVQFLSSKKIHQVVDVRKNPLSRKKGFSKHKLAENLSKKKITYLHLPGLGVPTLWRKQAKKKQITRKKMFSDYVKKIIPHCENEIQEILECAADNNLALLCYETDESDCHRHFVALKLKSSSKRKIQIVNLVPTNASARIPFLGK